MCACGRKRRTEVISSAQLTAEQKLVTEVEQHLASQNSAIANSGSRVTRSRSAQ